MAGAPVEEDATVQFFSCAPFAEDQEPVRAELVLVHHGGSTIDLAFCPHPRPHWMSDTRRGGPAPLMAVLGNGHVVVWTLPDLTEVRAAAEAKGIRTSLRSTEGAGAGAGAGRAADAPSVPLFLAVDPALVLTELREADEMPTCCAWMRCDPFDVIAVGTWTGLISVQKIVPATATEPLRTVRMTALLAPGFEPVRCLSFFPSPPTAPGEPLDPAIAAERRNFLVAGQNDGRVKLWDLREPTSAAAELSGNRSAVMDLVVTADPLAVAYVTDGGSSVHAAVLDSRFEGVGGAFVGNIRYVGSYANALFGVACGADLPLVAYVGEDGEAVLMLENEESINHRGKRIQRTIDGKRHMVGGNEGIEKQLTILGG